MASLTSEPSRMVGVLDPARRETLYQLVDGIATYMRSQVELIGEKRSRARRNTSVSQTSETPTTEDAEGEVGNQTAKTEAIASASAEQTAVDVDLIALRKSALKHFDEWKEDVLSRLKELPHAKDKSKIQGSEDAPSGFEATLYEEQDSTPVSETQDWTKTVENHQAFYQPISTSLTALPIEDRTGVLSTMLLLLLSNGTYSAYSRTLMAYLVSSLELPLSVLNKVERETATTMIKMSKAADQTQKDVAVVSEDEIQKRAQEERANRYWKVGLASAAGAAVIGVTGGLAGPVVAGVVGGLMSSVGAGGLASVLGIFWTKGALVGTFFGAFGAGMTGGVVDKYAREVQDFKFLPLAKEKESQADTDNTETRRLRVTIGINGWLNSEDEVAKPWCVFGEDSEAFALRYENKILLKLAQALEEMASSRTATENERDILPPAVLATFKAAMWPVNMLKSAAGLDDPSDLARKRAKKAGRVLADTLINRVQGERPITLVGYSLGARVVSSCLETLADRRAFGLVDTVVFIGAPVSACRSDWQTMRSVVASKMFNVFSRDDYLLRFLDRATSNQDGIAGLQAVESIEGLSNIDLSAEVKEHLQYPNLIASILRKCGFVDISETLDEHTTKDPDLPNGEERPEESQVATRTAEAPVEPAVVKPLSKKSHRQVSFPSGISRTETPPVVSKVQSGAATGSPGRRLSTMKRKSPAGPSSKRNLQADGEDKSQESTTKDTEE